MVNSNLALEISHEQLQAITKQARLELARRYAKAKDILNWGKVLFPEKFPLPFCEQLHGYFVEVRGEEFTATEAPRNHSKTTVRCFLIPLFQALEEPNIFRHYLNVQSNLTKAMAINSSIKQELETNEDLFALYGNQMGEKWNEQQFVLKNGTVFTALGAGQSIRGLNYRNIRPDYILVDDLYDEEDIYNPEATLKKNAWFWGSLFPSRAKTKRCSFHIQGTAINREDLLEKLKAQSRWKCKTFKAIVDWTKKEVLWPALNTFESLMADLEDMATTIFMRENQNERRDEASALVKSNWLTDWEYDPDKVEFVSEAESGKKENAGKLILKEVILGMDPSIGENPGNDFTGAALVLRAQQTDSRNNLYFIENVWNEHLSLEGRIKLLQDISDQRTQTGKPKVTRCLIEAIAGFKDFAAEARRKVSLNIRIVDHVKNKLANLENKSHHFENKRVFLNKNIPSKLKEIVRYQLTNNYPTHDDVRDGILLTIEGKQTGPMITVIQ